MKLATRQKLEIAFYSVLSAGVAFAAGWYVGVDTAFTHAKASLLR